MRDCLTTQKQHSIWYVCCVQVLSFNELGMDALIKPKNQIVVMVVSSTGEGDPPDNSARFYGHSK